MGGGRVAGVPAVLRSDSPWSTVRATEWVPSSGRASGTVTVLNAAYFLERGSPSGGVCFGIIRRADHSQRTMDALMCDYTYQCGTETWCYEGDYGNICGTGTNIQWGLETVKTGDQMTVAVNGGKLTFPPERCGSRHPDRPSGWL